MIYVDALRWRLDPRTLRRKRWAHMIATEGLDELHAAARALGLRRAWAQDIHGRHPHYDLRPRSYARALASGATLVGSKELIRLMRRSAGTGSHPSTTSLRT